MILNNVFLFLGLEIKFGIRSFFTYQNKYSTRKTLNLKRTNHNTIKTQYFVQIQDRINKTKNNKASGTTKFLRNNNGSKIKIKSQTIHHVDG